MKLNHVNLTVTEVSEAHAFLEKYFELKSMGCHKEIAFLTDDNGAVITLMSAKMSHESEVRYPGGFHIGFTQETAAQVDAVNQRLRDDGFDVPPPSRQHGSWTFYIQAPGGFIVEVQALANNPLLKE